MRRSNHIKIYGNFEEKSTSWIVWVGKIVTLVKVRGALLKIFIEIPGCWNICWTYYERHPDGSLVKIRRRPKWCDEKLELKKDRKAGTSQEENTLPTSNHHFPGIMLTFGCVPGVHRYMVSECIDIIWRIAWRTFAAGISSNRRKRWHGSSWAYEGVEEKKCVSSPVWSLVLCLGDHYFDGQNPTNLNPTSVMISWSLCIYL